MGRWVKKWKIPGSKGNVWTVAIDKDGNYGCSCPLWKFKRIQCHHIEAVKAGRGDEVKEPEIGFAHVREVTLRNGKILVPLTPIGDTHFAATIAFDLMRLGVPSGTIKRYNEIAERNSMKKIREYIEARGRRIYGPDIDPMTNQFRGFEIVPLEPGERRR